MSDQSTIPIKPAPAFAEAAERLWLRITAPDTHRAAKILSLIRKATRLLAYSCSSRALRKVDADIYTQIQSALKGKTKISSRSILPRAEKLFTAVSDLLRFLESVPGDRTVLSGIITDNMTAADGLLLALERQICAATAARALKHSLEFSSRVEAMRARLAQSRHEIHSCRDFSASLNALTLLDGFAGLIAAAEKLACFDIRARLAGKERKAPAPRR